MMWKNIITAATITISILKIMNYLCILECWGNNNKDEDKEVPHGVMVIVVGNGHDDTSSNPGRDWLHFT